MVVVVSKGKDDHDVFDLTVAVVGWREPLVEQGCVGVGKSESVRRLRLRAKRQELRNSGKWCRLEGDEETLTGTFLRRRIFEPVFLPHI